MEWLVAGIMLLQFAYSLYMQSKFNVQRPVPGHINGPTAAEGISIPVVFGTKQIPNPNICWWGDASSYLSSPDVQPQVMLYFIGIQFAICHGKIDSLIDLSIGDQALLSNPVNADNGAVHIGPAWELEVEERPLGNIEVKLGQANLAGTDAGLVDYMSGQLALAKGPHYYGVATVVAEHFYVGHNPYLKPWAFIVSRIHTRNGGDTQWYDEKAEINIGRDREDVWKYKIQDTSDDSDWSDADYDDSAWDEGRGGIGNAAVDSLFTNTWSDGSYTIPAVRTCLVGDGTYIGPTHDYKNAWVKSGLKLWLRWDLGPMRAVPLGVQCWHDDSATLWFNGTSIPLVPTVVPNIPGNEHFNSTATIPADLINENGPNVVAYRVRDSFDASGNQIGTNRFIYGGIQVGASTSSPARTLDMNPAHIIHEVLTDIFWGMGYSEAELDDASFRAAADTLYAENFGLSFEWSAQMAIEDFLSDILRHISGVVYVDRSTGLFVLKLLRDDYNVADLLVLDEANISKIEGATRKLTGELVNTVTVTYAATRRGDQGSVTIFEEGLLRSQGGTVCSKIDYPAITNQYNAAKVALRDLRMLSTPLLSCTIYASRLAAGLNCGDPFVLDWPDLGIVSEAMRVTAIDVGNGIDNQVKVTCVEDVFSFPAHAMVVPNEALPNPPTVRSPDIASDTYCTAVTKDVRDKGMVECVYRSDGEAGLFTGWTQDATGAWARDVVGPLGAPDHIRDPYAFDGVDVGADDHSGTSWLLGKRVLAWMSDSVYDKENTGVYIMDDVGGHWENYDDPVLRAYVATHMRMHRDPDFDESADFVKDMIFQVRKGALYALDFFQLTTSNAVLGEPLEWTAIEGPTFAWTNECKLLQASQLATENVSQETVDMWTMGGSGGADFPAFPSRQGSPGTGCIPAALWKFNIEACWLDSSYAGSSGSITTLGIEVWRESDGLSSGGVLFEVLSAQITAEVPTALPVINYSSPDVALAETDRIVLIPTMHTNSTTPVKMWLRVSSPSHGTYVAIPRTVTADPARSAQRMASYG